MIDCGLSENTRKSYLNAVTGLARHYGGSPDCIDAREVQHFLIFLHERRGLTWKSCHTIRHGLRFFYRIILGRAMRDPVDVKLLAQDDELYILAQSRARVLKERGMRRRPLKKLRQRSCARFGAELRKSG